MSPTARFSGLQALAPAKVNLYLHVGGPDASGYHPLSSLVVFADVGDRLTIEPAEAFSLEVEGAFAPELQGEADNLVARAARAFAELAGPDRVGARLKLDKRLPIASGVGGGSADAGAALRLLRRALSPELADVELARAAARLGADGPMCLSSHPAVAEGYGERLTAAPVLPELHAVLVNPRAPSPTGPVYRAYDAAVAPEGAGAAQPPAGPLGFDALVDWLKTTRNDLQAPAVALAPAIGLTLESLSAQPEARFVRMSGSGATCFALCRSQADAHALAARLGKVRPDWWIAPCRLGGPWAEAFPLDRGDMVKA